MKKSLLLLNFKVFFSISEGSIFPDYLEVAAAVVVPHGVGRTCLYSTITLDFMIAFLK